jgi:hypothetical protein
MSNRRGHFFLAFPERGNQVAPGIGRRTRNPCHAFGIEAISLLQGGVANNCYGCFPL